MASGSISDWVIRNHRHYVVVNKPAGLAVQTSDEDQKDLLQIMSAYTKCDLHAVHRIDQPVSGAVILAKSGEVAGQLSQALNQPSTTKRYIALVAKVENFVASQSLQHYLRKRGSKSMVSSADDDKAKKADLTYTHVGDLDRYHALQVDIVTGRFHQIRVQLAKGGMPIQGDVKYGARRGNRDRSIGLHAWQIHFDDSISEERMIVQAPLPESGMWPHVTALLQDE